MEVQKGREWASLLQLHWYPWGTAKPGWQRRRLSNSRCDFLHCCPSNLPQCQNNSYSGVCLTWDAGIGMLECFPYCFLSWIITHQHQSVHEPEMHGRTCSGFKLSHVEVFWDQLIHREDKLCVSQLPLGLNAMRLFSTLNWYIRIPDEESQIIPVYFSLSGFPLIYSRLHHHLSLTSMTSARKFTSFWEGSGGEISI